MSSCLSSSHSALCGKWIDAKKRKANIVFTSSMGGLFTPANWGVYVSTKHALESIAEALKQELEPYGIKVQMINPAPSIPDTTRPWRTRRSAGLTTASTSPSARRFARSSNSFLKAPDGHLDAREMIDRMIEIVPADTGKFRNVVPKATEDMLKAHQHVYRDIR